MTSDCPHRRALVALLALLLGGPAWAGDAKEIARQHFAAGLEAAARRDYTLAIGEFMASYAQVPHPTTAKNIAKAYDDLGELARARLWYRRFQQLDPTRSGEVAAELARLEARIDPRAPPPKPVPLPQPAATPAPASTPPPAATTPAPPPPPPTDP